MDRIEAASAFTCFGSNLVEPRVLQFSPETAIRATSTQSLLFIINYILLLLLYYYYYYY